MSHTCTVEERKRIHAARDRLEMHDRVETTDVLDPHRDRIGRWTIEVVVSDQSVHHDILDILGSYRLHARTLQRQGEVSILVAHV